MHPMQPLVRQESRSSIFSWWSDSNPGLRGPTINLHTATKPLLRYLHHRQALELLAKNRSSPLSDAVLEVYLWFFSCNYISFSTKAAIVEELAARSLSAETDARAVVGSPILLEMIISMLECCDARMERSCCRLLGNLANHESTAPDVLKLKPCLQLVSLLCGGDSKVVALAMYALSAIARYEDGAEAIVEAKALDHALELLTSSDALTQEWTCELLARIACRESTALAVLAIKPCGPLMTLLRDGDARIILPAQLALLKVAELLDSEARAIGDPRAIDHLLDLFKSEDCESLMRTCKLVGQLARYQHAAPILLDSRICEPLVALLRSGKPKVITLAVHTLSVVAKYGDGAEAIVEAKALDHALELLTSSDALTQRWTCELLRIACRESTAPAVLAIKPCGPLMTLLRDGDASTIQPAQLALSKVAELLDSQARPVGDPRAIDYLLELFKSEDRESLMRTCKLVGQIARDQCTVPILLDLRMCERLMALLYDDDLNVIIWAIAMLGQIARWVDWVQAVVDAGFTAHVLDSSHLPSQIVRPSSCSIVARYETTAMLTSTVKRFFLVADDEELVLPLCRMAESTSGARAIVDTNGVRHILRLLDSPIPFVRKHTCLLIATLAVCQSIASAVSNFKLCMGLVSLFDIDEHGLQRDAAWAMYALYHIASRPDGAQAVVKANATRHILRFLRSSSTTVRKYTCQLVAKLALHESTAMELLNLGAHVSLVSLLRDDHGGSQVVDQVMSGLSQWADGVAVIC